MTGRPTILAVRDIREDVSAQPRDSINTDIVAEYAAAMADGAQFPPIVVFQDPVQTSVWWLADGFHRLHARRGAGFAHIDAIEHEGDLRSAVLYSCSANGDHGLRRSAEDKRRAVRRLLDDAEWVHWSDREIARQCRVSQPFVSKLRPVLTDNVISQRTYTTRHGTVSKMETRSIGTPPRRAPETAGELAAIATAIHKARSVEPNAGQPDPTSESWLSDWREQNARTDIPNAIEQIDALLKGLPGPEAAAKVFPPAHRHAFSHERLLHLADWLARFAASWLENEEGAA